MRFLLLTMAIIAVDFVLPFGTHPALLSVGILGGVIVGSRSSNLKLLGVLLITTIGGALSINLVALILALLGDSSLKSYSIFLHLETVLFLFFSTFILTWAVKKYKAAFLVELGLILTVVVGSLATHRNLQLDMPKIINDLSWQLGVSPLTTFSAFGVIVALLAVIYGALSVRQFSDQRAAISKRISIFGIFLSTFIFLLIGYLSFFGISSYYQEKGEAFFSNGVGQGSEEGLSPLTFESALGSTNQPAGLVRLESDYPMNPTSPMLYLRESALSKYNGKELVLSNIDDDISRDTPGVSFSQVRKEVLSRSELTQEIYLLADHKNPFAIDYPKLLTPLKNPNQGKFKGGAYRALSFSLGLKLETLRNTPVGDPLWDSAKRANYLAAHTDPRYHELAKKITTDSPTPFDSIQKIVDYLAQFTIYTLTPNHAASEDPVAPYLFGDGRGYCVHIAHATVYLLRAIGIPSRIATGYLTDLSQAKDGHILLRMSDRHAWAEVYFQDYGWIAFDTQPLQVESHADTEVDQGLLEELMNLVNPAEDLVPELPSKKDSESSSFSVTWLKPALIGSLLLIIFLVILSKLLLLKGYAIFPSLKKIIPYAMAMDIGFKREYGETRLSFAKRLTNKGLNILEFTKSLNQDKYQGETKLEIPKQNLPMWQKIKILLNPKSVFNWWFKRRW